MNFKINTRHNNTILIAVFTIWLFHISGIIGISLGFQDWFIPKTPLNLLLLFLFMLGVYPIKNAKTIGLAILFFIIGMLVEWIGVHNDWLFGPYEYGNNLGIKLDGVPLLIGINWMILTFVTANILNAVTQQKWLRIIGASLLMVFLDFFLELSAPIFDFWHFEQGIAPLRNYIVWFLISALLHFFFQLSKCPLNFTLSVNIYLSQLLFFIYFYVYYSL